MAPPRSLAVIGTGLIGASVGLAARRVGVERVTGWDPDPGNLAVAADRGAVDPARDLEAAIGGAELAVVAVPVTALPAQVRAVLDASGEETTVTDVGSTKGGVCAEASKEHRFIGGHPICGAEAPGPAHATSDLFEGATWFLTPLATSEPERYKLLHDFVGSVGAIPVAIEPEAHDRLVAVTSHLPHVLANVLLNQTGASRIDGHDLLTAAGRSLRDMTRIAGANPRMWVDIFLENSEAVRGALGEHRRRIEQVEAALVAGDAGFLARWIGEAAGNRRTMLATAHADPGELQRLRVHVPDRPGVLAGITQALGADRINIEEFELQHMSPDRGGTLNILIAGERQAERAAGILETQGYGVVVTPVLDGDAVDE